MPSRLHFKAMLKSLIWIGIGAVFGTATFISVFTSSLLFKNSHTTIAGVIKSSSQFNYDYLLYLCVCLMAGAAADHCCSTNKTISSRILPISACVIALGIVFYVFNPAVKYDLNSNILDILTYTYVGGTVIFCASLKTPIFYQEIKQFQPK